MANDIDLIIHRLSNADSENWAETLIESATEIEASMTKGWGLQSRRLPGRKSNTVTLLSALINHDFVTADAIIAKQSESSEATVNHHKATNSFRLFNRNKINHNKACEPINTDQQKYLYYKTIIFELIEILKNEQESLSQSCLPFLHRYEIDTKREKQIALTELLNADNYASLTKIAIIIQHKTRVMRSKKTSRVSTLVQALINPDAVIEDLRHEVLRYQANLQQSDTNEIAQPLLPIQSRLTPHH